MFFYVCIVFVGIFRLKKKSRSRCPFSIWVISSVYYITLIFSLVKVHRKEDYKKIKEIFSLIRSWTFPIICTNTPLALDSVYYVVSSSWEGEIPSGCENWGWFIYIWFEFLSGWRNTLGLRELRLIYIGSGNDTLTFEDDIYNSSVLRLFPPLFNLYSFTAGPNTLSLPPKVFDVYPYRLQLDVSLSEYFLPSTMVTSFAEWSSLISLIGIKVTTP